MKPTTSDKRLITVLRWIARVWSLIILGVVVLIAVTPDPNVVGPVPVVEWVEVGLVGVAAVGLVLAWRWEATGALIALVAVAVQDIVFRLDRGVWFHSMGSTAILMLVFAVPAGLYLLCWYLSRQTLDQPQLRTRT